MTRARSPDLTPFFLWGCLKSKVYNNRPNNLEDLKARIQHEIRLISPQTIQNVRHNARKIIFDKYKGW
jgi:hypothetical protein